MLARMPRALLHAEGLALFAAALALYIDGDYSILALLVLFLVPDLSFFGFAINSRTGALVYNVMHTELFPLVLGAAGLLADSAVPVQLALIWLAHIGMDRMLGYGLKYPTGFKDTHFERV